MALGFQHPSLAFQVSGTSSEVFPKQQHPLSDVWRDLADHLPSQAGSLPPQDFPIRQPPKQHRGKSRASLPHWGLQRILPAQSQLPDSGESCTPPTSPTSSPVGSESPIFHLLGTQTKAKEAQPTIKNDASQQTK